MVKQCSIIMKKLLFSFILLIFLFLQNTSAQQLGMNASIFRANGDFNRNIDHHPAGISINYLHDVGQSRLLSVGGEIGVAMYSSKTYVVKDQNQQDVSIYEEDCFWTVHMLAQYKLYSSPITAVYVEGRTGLTTFFSSKMPEEENTGFDDEFKLHGSAFNTGFGGGIKLNLSGLYRGDGSYNKIWLDMGTTMNSGSRTNYRNANENTKSLEEANFTSLTNYINYRIGINYRFY